MNQELLFLRLPRLILEFFEALEFVFKYEEMKYMINKTIAI